MSNGAGGRQFQTGLMKGSKIYCLKIGGLSLANLLFIWIPENLSTTIHKTLIENLACRKLPVRAYRQFSQKIRKNFGLHRYIGRNLDVSFHSGNQSQVFKQRIQHLKELSLLANSSQSSFLTEKGYYCCSVLYLLGQNENLKNIMIRSDGYPIFGEEDYSKVCGYSMTTFDLTSLFKRGNY